MADKKYDSNNTLSIRFKAFDKKEMELKEFIIDYPVTYQNKGAFAKELLMIGYEAYKKGIFDSKAMAHSTPTLYSENTNDTIRGASSLEFSQMMGMLEQLLEENKRLQFELQKQQVELHKQIDEKSELVIDTLSKQLENSVIQTSTSSSDDSNGNLETVATVYEKPNEPQVDEEDETLMQPDEEFINSTENLLAFFDNNTEK